MGKVEEQKLAAVQAEILAERAASLRLSEQQLVDSLQAFAAVDTGEPALQPRREQLAVKASQACLIYIVQREALGMSAAELPTFRADYGIPDEVWNRMGSQ